MLNKYRYRGKHRAPTYTGRKIATVTVALAIPSLAMTGEAQAAEGPDWAPIIKCESGGDPRAKNPLSTASGLFQFINGTWAAYGGLKYAPTARQATAAEQRIIANRAYADAGYTPWNSSKGCWGGKVGKAPTAEVKTEPNVKKRPTPKRVEKPAAAVKPKPVVPKTSVPTYGTDGVYTIKSGDTLTNIAVANGTDWKTIYDKNRSVVEHQDWIFPGEKLDI